MNTSAETIEAITSLGRKASEIKVDLSDQSKLQQTFDQALELTGHVDILVNNAGIIRRKPAKDHGTQDWLDVIDLNLNTVFCCPNLPEDI